MKDLHALPKVRDSWTYLYVEHCRVEQDDQAIAIHDARGKTPVPCATLNALLLGPGCNVTHAAIRALADCGCLVAWTGEQGVRFYAVGMGETRSARNMLRQTRLWADPAQRMAVVRRMYQMRFPGPINPNLTLQQLRGLEGSRVREAYAAASRQFGVPWSRRSYRREEWGAADPVNRALSAGNSCLYGVCHAAIVAAGFSAAHGFIHTGKMMSFVYDIADLYKTDVTIPVAFRAVAEGEAKLETRVRHTLRDAFHEQKILKRIIPDIEAALGLDPAGEEADAAVDSDEALPGGLWDPDSDPAGGVNYGADQEDEDP